MRNLSVNQYWLQRARNHSPRYRFGGTNQSQWRQWHDELLPAVKQTLGAMPKKVPLNPELVAEWRQDGLIKQRVYIDVEEGLSAAAYVFRPENASGRLPAILCCHGHGPYGKDSVMGNDSDPAQAAKISQLNYNYGLQMAKAGYVTIAIDLRGFGERDDRLKPNHNDLARGRDQCNIHYLFATLLGTTTLAQNIHDNSCAIDYLCGQPFVDPDRIGVMGLSQGGTMTTWMSICDDRIKATDILCYSDRFADFGYRDTNFCGSQITPGLFALGDVPDLQGLIAPRPLLVEIGVFDDCFLLDSAMSCFKEVEKIYAAAGARDRLELDLFEGGHAWGANRSREFFARHLGKSNVA
jgi:dienelactone hydrolase